MIVRVRDAAFIETPGGNFGAAIATPSRDATEVSVIRQRQMPGGANPLHSHDREEVLVMLAGSVTVTVAGQQQRVGTGDAVIVPAETPHSVTNAGSEPADWLLVAPAGVRFFHANGDEATPPWSR